MIKGWVLEAENKQDEESIKLFKRYAEEVFPGCEMRFSVVEGEENKRVEILWRHENPNA